MNCTRFDAGDLPASCLKLPERAQQMLVELVRFARQYAIRQTMPSGTMTVNVHFPKWLIEESIGRSEDTVRRYLATPAAQQVVRYVPHVVEGRHHRITDGCIFAISLSPTEGKRPRIDFERDRVYRMLPEDKAKGRVRGSYPTSHKTLSQTLIDWTSQEIETPVNHPRMPVDNYHQAMLAALEQKCARSIQHAAELIGHLFGEAGQFDKLWMKVLWRARTLSPSGQQWLITRIRSFQEPGLRRPGFLCMQELKVQGLL